MGDIEDVITLQIIFGRLTISKKDSLIFVAHAVKLRIGSITIGTLMGVRLPFALGAFVKTLGLLHFHTGHGRGSAGIVTRHGPHRVGGAAGAVSPRQPADDHRRGHRRSTGSGGRGPFG